MKKTIATLLFFIFLLSIVFSQEFSLQATVTVNPPPMNLDVGIVLLPEVVWAGEDLNFLIALEKEGEEEITMELKYELIRKRGGREEVILTEFDLALLGDYLEKSASIHIPPNVRPGKYYLRVTASYFNQTDMDEESFKIKAKNWNSFLEWLFSLFQKFTL